MWIKPFSCLCCNRNLQELQEERSSLGKCKYHIFPGKYWIYKLYECINGSESQLCGNGLVLANESLSSVGNSEVVALNGA